MCLRAFQNATPSIGQSSVRWVSLNVIMVNVISLLMWSVLMGSIWLLVLFANFVNCTCDVPPSISKCHSEYWAKSSIRWVSLNVIMVNVISLLMWSVLIGYFWLLVLFVRMRDSYTNPYESKRIESFEISGLTNRNESNLLRFLVLRNESTIRILKVRIRESGFANPKLQDS